MSDMLDIVQDVNYDNSIVKFDYHSYSSFLSSYNNNDEIRISLQHQDLYVLPSKSFLYIEGRLTKPDGTLSNTARLINNAAAFLFDEIRYELNGVEIDRNRNVGITSSLKNYVSLNVNQSNTLFNASWSPTEAITLVDGRFNFCVPLDKILGFAEDYKKIIINAKHELILTRTRNDENAVLSVADQTTISILKLQWRVPHVTVAEHEKLAILKVIQRGVSLQMCFRSWDMYEYPVLPTTTQHNWTVKTSNQLEKPRFIIFALQTDKKNQRAMDNSKFDHCSVTDIKLHLNSESFPYDDLNVKFSEDRFALLYEMYMRFQQAYYGSSPQPLLSRRQFRDNAPIVVLDCSYQNESIKSGPVDVRIDFKTEANIPANTSAYCLMLHDRIIEYNPLTTAVRKLM